jgi:hypothetical protein
MDRVFVSSIQAGYGDVRARVREALESLGKRPLMAETVGASPDPSRRTLLDQVANCDVFLLILGSRYGDRGESGFSPTEDEFNEARQLGRPIIALIQEGERQAAQDEFIARVRGSWEEGHYAPTFKGADDVGMAVVRAFRQLEEGEQTQARALPAAQARAKELAELQDRRGSGSGAQARLVAVPVLGRPLLDALALDEPALGDDLMRLARDSGLVGQALGIEHAITTDGVRMVASNERDWERVELFVGSDGAVVAEASVGGTGNFGGSLVMADRLEQVLTQAADLALSVWSRIDRGGDVRQVAVTAAIPDSSYKVFATEDVGNSMGMSMSLPPHVVAPDPAIAVRREDLAGAEAIRRIVAAIKRVFQDAGGIHPRRD